MKLTLHISGDTIDELNDSLENVKELLGEGFTNCGIDLDDGSGFYFELEKEEEKTLVAQSH